MGANDGTFFGQKIMKMNCKLIAMLSDITPYELCISDSSDWRHRRNFSNVCLFLKCNAHVSWIYHHIACIICNCLPVQSRFIFSLQKVIYHRHQITIRMPILFYELLIVLLVSNTYKFFHIIFDYHTKVCRLFWLSCSCFNSCMPNFLLGWN